MFKLALRNILRQKSRTSMTLAAIVFGVSGLILTGGFVADVLTQLGEATIHSQLGHVQVFKQGFYEKGSRSPEKYVIEDADQIARFAAKMPEADTVLQRIRFAGLLNNGKADWAIVGEGVEPDKENHLGTFVRITAGRQLKDEDASGVLIGDGVAKALALEPGDTVTLIMNTADGALNTTELNVVGVFQSFSKDFDTRAVRIPIAAARELLARDGANSIVLLLHRTSDTALVKDLLVPRLQSLGFDIRDWVELSDFYAKTVELYRTQFGVLQWIVLIMVLLSVFNTVNMSVFERVGEFGTLMALGNTRGYVFRLVMVENAMLGLFGAVVGVVLGTLAALAISEVGIPMPPPPNSNVAYTATVRVLPNTVFLAFGVGLIATLVAALLPAHRVSRTPIVDALRYNI
ncbi:ABC transporter permease [Methyloversatilis sp.]|uniref:ABC transporter permease n=1 Tax=Methyloversatilis sp. TaxID=2569862 RepID=UPI002733E437|nr:ABC transporter permease [Methyloversatilis sp.]MDP2867675.1 ABC transporter permease [Methyloversatilis sp.]MDP3290175.1 ABC transporter permease [Methyloversatilis sp.]MDP3456669.1 ABC transporter permease [Methyloversatilis sp.]MDP3577239.1 ABC transporter permease [Methyloversatilis sp.]